MSQEEWKEKKTQERQDDCTIIPINLEEITQKETRHLQSLWYRVNKKRNLDRKKSSVKKGKIVRS